MRILVLSQYFWPETFRINALVEALADAGAKVTVLTGQPNYPDGAVFPGYRAGSIRKEHFREDVEVIRVPIIPRGNASGARLAANYLSFVATAATIGPFLLRGRQFDVVFVYAPSPITQAIPGMVVKRAFGAKLVTWVQDLWPESLQATGFLRNETLLELARRIVAWIYSGHDLLLGQSRAFVGAIQSVAPRTPVEYFPNPGDGSPVSEEPGRTPLQLAPGFNVVFAGNLGTVQALETVLDAADLLRLHPDVRIVLAGSGSRLPWLQQETTRRGLSNVILAGRFEPGEMPGIFAQADALLVSLNRGETLSQTIPSKVQAYLAAGRPILASLDGEAAALVTDAGAGFASAAEDATGLAENVLRLRALTPEQRAAMGTAGQDVYRREFDPHALALRLVQRLSALVAQHD